VSKKWEAAVVVLLGAVAVAAVGLGRWQLRRLRQRKAANAAELTARALPVVSLSTAIIDHTPLAGRRVDARGRFDTAQQVLLRGRVQDEAPGLQVVTLFTVEHTDASIWVLRGFVPSPDAVTPPRVIPAPDTGVVEVRGLAVAIAAGGDGPRPVAFHGDTTWSRLDSAALHRRTPRSADVYLLLEGDSTGPGHLAVVPPAPLTNGPHLSYAVQWFGIASGAVAFAALIIVRGRRRIPRRPLAP
jgi:surfeit locus 1 family protein